MTTKELLHDVKDVHIFTLAAISATNTGVLDTFRSESAGFLVDVMAGNFSGSVGVALSLQESDASGSGFAVPPTPMFVEWFQDGVPGYPDNVAGAWVPLAQAYMNIAITLNPLTLQHVNFQGHMYTCSYVNGQHRYILLNMAPIGAPTNVVSICGLLNSPTETTLKAFRNYPYAADFPSITFP